MIRVVAAAAALLMAGYAYAQPKKNVCREYSEQWWAGRCVTLPDRLKPTRRDFDANRGSVRSHRSSVGPPSPVAAQQYWRHRRGGVRIRD
jgi:hypothetical protein